jgi:uncharacterized protein with von Willebrand factor type A (vWA) domain
MKNTNENKQALKVLQTEFAGLLQNQPEYKTFSKQHPDLDHQVMEESVPKLKEVLEQINLEPPPAEDSIYKALQNLEGFRVLEFLKRNQRIIRSQYDCLPVSGYIEKYNQLQKQHEKKPIAKEALKKHNTDIYSRAKKLKQAILYSIKTSNQEKFKNKIDALKKSFMIKMMQEILERLKRFKALMDFHPDNRTANTWWDLSKGTWQRSEMQELLNWKKRFETDPALKQLITMIGRSKSYSEFTSRLMQVMRRTDNVIYENSYKEEMFGIMEGRDLSSLLPFELLSLCDSDAELLFYKKYMENKLGIYEYFNTSVQEVMEEGEENRQEEDKKVQQGPVILCIDTSGSMQSFGRLPEMIAKSLSLCVIMRALAEKRHVYLISFSTGVETVEFNPSTFQISDLLNFLSMSFNGGTDPQPALREGIHKTKCSNFADADIVMVSDFLMDSLGSAISNEMQEVKAQGTRFMSLIVSQDAGYRGVDGFDHTWHINVNKPNKLVQLN